MRRDARDLTARADEAGLAEADLLRARILERRRGTLLSDSADDLAAIHAGER